MRSARAARLLDEVSELLEPEVVVSVLLPEAPMVPLLPEVEGLLLEVSEDDDGVVVDEEPLAPIVLGEELDEPEADDGAVVLPDEPEAPIDCVDEGVLPAAGVAPLPPEEPEAVEPAEPDVPLDWAMA
ncbi:hypothetical protein [Ramlibacter humi]|uniref:Uncharacterized protein n=1 Tax=Ramlibacter humi TaxID=2530451 RepID=A0A4Z0BXT8_9BURK|nr:hypothetical protein [Ramlibacter humi]TFZ04137.1 hypothetical protein EZ216_10935 [Ramlibacter humi]